jgi:hypothetical protein
VAADQGRAIDYKLLISKDEVMKDLITRFKYIAMSLTVGVVLFVVVGVAMATNIDTFNVGVNAGTAQIACEGGSVCPLIGSPKTTTADPGASTTISVERDLEVTRTTGTGAVFLYVGNGGDNRASMSIDTGSRGEGTITWDGEDNDATSLDATGLGGLNFNPDDGILVTIVDADRQSNISLRVYSDTNNYMDLTRAVPSDIVTRTDFFYRFADFSVTGGATTGDIIQNVGAVSLNIDGTIQDGLDLALDFVETAAVREYGDLPLAYSAADRSGSHIPAGTRLGELLDTESAHQPDVNANGDDPAAVDDEDGVVRTDGVLWNSGGTGSVDVTINGCPTSTCRFNMWIDWNDDGAFNSGSEHILNDSAQGNGDQTLTFSIPVSVTIFNNSFYVRTRVCNTTTTCNTTTAANVDDGEIEDYRWGFGPTAIILQVQKAHSPEFVYGLILVAASALLFSMYLLYFRPRIARRERVVSN